MKLVVIGLGQCGGRIADEFAAQQTNQRAAYAETLVRFSRSGPIVELGALAMAGTESNLFRRVEMLLNDSFRVFSSGYIVHSQISRAKNSVDYL